MERNMAWKPWQPISRWMKVLYQTGSQRRVVQVALVLLTATLCATLPKIKPDYPRDDNGNLINKALSDSEWEKYQGLMGHYHVQTNKQDPGPAFQWDKVVNGARKRMGLKPLREGDIINNPKTEMAKQ